MPTCCSEDRNNARIRVRRISKGETFYPCLRGGHCSRGSAVNGVLLSHRIVADSIVLECSAFTSMMRSSVKLARAGIGRTDP